MPCAEEGHPAGTPLPNSVCRRSASAQSADAIVEPTVACVRQHGRMTKTRDDIVLTGTHVQLEPLSLDHVHQLVVAANEDRTSYGWTPVPDSVSGMTSY